MTDIKQLFGQYDRLHENHKGYLLLFRDDDRYITFGGDAIATSKVTGSMLSRLPSSRRFFTAFFYMDLDTHLPALARAGHKVAIVDQIQPEQQKRKRLMDYLD